LALARERAYAAADMIEWDGMQIRRDIAAEAAEAAGGAQSDQTVQSASQEFAR
jgi:hypothetical protein